MQRLHKLSAVIDGFQGGLQVGSFAVFAVFFLGQQVAWMDPLWAFALGPLGFLIGAGYQVAYYYRFTYELTDEELVVASGVFGRQKREIPLERIQNVDIRRPALKRALGLAVVKFETAGGSSTEATLDAVGTTEADRLQREVSSRVRRIRAGERGVPERETDRGAVGDDSRGAVGDDRRGLEDAVHDDHADGERDDYELLYTISDRELRVLSAVSFRPGAFAVPFVGVPFGGEDLPVFVLRRLGIDLREGVRSLAALDVLTIGVLFVGTVLSYLLAVWLVSVALTYLQYYDFRLERHGEELRYERGLLGRYSGTIPLDKVQTVTLGENVLMRRFGYAALGVETAGYAPGADGGGAETTVPLATRRRVLDLARDVLAASDETGRYDTTTVFGSGDGDVGEMTTSGEGESAHGERAETSGEEATKPDAPVVDPAFHNPEAVARKRYTRRYLIALGIVVAGIAGVAAVTPAPLWLALGPALFAPLTPFAARAKWNNRGYYETDWSLLTRNGFWRRHTRIVPSFRLQTVIVTRTIFQRRWGLASVTADTASSASVVGGDAKVFDVAPEKAEELRESLLVRLGDSLADRKREEKRRRERREKRRARRLEDDDAPGSTADDGSDGTVNDDPDHTQGDDSANTGQTTENTVQSNGGSAAGDGDEQRE
jgi:putative membrane protein